MPASDNFVINLVSSISTASCLIIWALFSVVTLCKVDLFGCFLFDMFFLIAKGQIFDFSFVLVLMDTLVNLHTGYSGLDRKKIPDVWLLLGIKVFVEV